MKKTLFFLFLPFLFVSTQGQTLAIHESLLKGDMVLIKDKTGFPLEKEKAVITVSSNTTSLSLLDYTTITTTSVIEGTKSTVRTSQHDKIQIIIHANDNSADPVNAVHLFQLTPDDLKNTRSFVLTKRTRFTHKSKEKSYMLPFTSAKYGKSSYLLTIDHLEPGEYALTVEEAKAQFNMFGVD